MHEGGYPGRCQGRKVAHVNASQILPNLFVGSYPASPKDIERLRDLGVTAVLSVQTDHDLGGGVGEDLYAQAGIDLRRVPVRDFDPGDLRRNLPRCVEVLDELLRQGHTVYLHCSMGINRSPSVAIAYLHWVQGWDLERAADHVLERSSCDPYLDVIRLATQDRARP